MKNIKSIEIKNSTFFEDFKIHFSEKMNCIMGGRGTGKSSILYFLKSALTLNSQEGKINEILKNNLGIGQIAIEIESNDGTLFKIVKSFNEEPQPYKLPDQEYISIFRIFDEIECDFYETNQIEEIGRSAENRLLLIDKKIKIKLHELLKQIEKSQIDLDANSQDIKTSNFRINQIKDSIIQYENIELDIKEHITNEPINIEPEEKKAFENADLNEKKRTDERRFFTKAKTLYNDLENQTYLISNDLKENFASAILNKNNFSNESEMNSCIQKLSSNNDTIFIKIKEINDLLNNNSQILNSNFREIFKIHETQQAEFVSLKQKFEKNRDFFSKYNILTNRLKDKETLIQEITEKEFKKQRLVNERKYLVEKFNNIKNDIFSLRLATIQDINNVLNGDIKITLKFSGINDEFESRLRDGLRGSGLRYNDLVKKIVEAFKPDQFAKVIQEKDVDSLKIIAGIDEVRSSSLINALYDTEDIYKIESTYCSDLPDFKLRIDGDSDRSSYKNSDELSMGQRCTTVLPIIFAVSENPLIIDQPEDNLDNKYISEKIHQIITEQKENRQLIFITHNPNIPVLSNSEYNLFLNYENKKSKRLIEGNVDEVKEEILKILEGGENAFKVRKEKYDINYEL